MTIVWTEKQWLLPGLIVLGLLTIGLVVSYRGRTSMPLGLRWFAGILKWIGCVLLLLFILQPEVVTTYNRPGTNHWAILLDRSASMTLKDQAGDLSRADRLQQVLPSEPLNWQRTLSDDFVVETYSYDARLRQAPALGALSFEGMGSNLGKALANLRSRYQGRPLAGILVMTDGSPTDSLGDLEDLPPTFPLVFSPEKRLVDLSVTSVTARATLFEDAPLIVDVTVAASGMKGQSFVARIHEYEGEKLEEKTQLVTRDRETMNLRFQVRPKALGTAFLVAEVAVEDPAELKEVTLENNRRLAAANRETGPYRVLYLGGRPNFEHKFLQRALEEDPSVQMTSLIRIAQREPKFNYLGRQGERSNPLYRGFEAQDEAERFDESVFIRLKTKDARELAGGFPRTAAELFPFDAVILDDVESGFFERDQQRLLQRFVSERGGSVLMLGGMESLDTGGYEGTPIGEMLPVYLEPETPAGQAIAGRYDLTREGRLEPWARLRATEEEESQRLRKMPEFKNVHRFPGIRPGALEIGRVATDLGSSPALVTRRYGRGHTAVLALTDLWRWGLRNPEARADLDKSWRQMVRWLISDVPRPLSLEAERNTGPRGGQRIATELLGEDFQPRDSGAVTLRVRRPDGTWTHLNSRPHLSKVGTQEALYFANTSGPYLVEAATRDTEETPALFAQAGWVVNALQDEYLAIQPDLAAMEDLAAKTGGRVLSADGLDEFVAGLENLPLPVEETRSEPLWHTSYWLIAIVACFVGEWALRRWKKLP